MNEASTPNRRRLRGNSFSLYHRGIRGGTTGLGQEEGILIEKARARMERSSIAGT